MPKAARLLLLCLFLGGALSGPARAAVPDPALSTVPDVISLTVGPTFGSNPIGTYTVTILDALAAPCAGIEVEIVFPTGADALIAWAPGQVFTEMTDVGGVATFTLEGGGCITAAAYGGPVAEIFADGVFMDDAYINSPDAVNSLGQLPTDIVADICEAGGVIRVGLSDVVFFTDAVVGALVFPCGDFFTPFGGPLTLGDVVAMTPYMRDGREATCAP